MKGTTYSSDKMMPLDSSNPLAEDLGNGIFVISPLAIMDSVTDMKRKLRSTPVKARAYDRDKYETLTGNKLPPSPNIKRFRKTLKKF